VDTRTRSTVNEIEVAERVAVPQIQEELWRQDARWQLVALVRPIWSHRRLIGRAGLYATVLGALIVLLIPNQYESTVQLMPPENASVANLALLSSFAGGGSGGTAGTATNIASDLLGMKSSAALFVAILESRTVQDGIIKNLDLQKVYSVGTYYKARKILSKRSEISEIRKSGSVSITVWDKDPRRAAAIAGAYVTELNRVLALSNTSSARRERIFLEERLKTAKQELDEAQKRFSEFASSKGTIDIKEQGRAMVEAAATLQGELIAAESVAKGLEQTYTPNNVRVRSLRARIAELKRQINKIGGSEDDQVTGETVDNPLYPSIRQLPILGVSWTDLYRRTKIAEIVYEALTKQYEIARVQEVKELPVARVFDEPMPAERKSFPPRLVLTLIFTLLGVLLGAGFVTVRELWRQSGSRDPLKMFITEVRQDVGQLWCRSPGVKLIERLASRVLKTQVSDNDT
jgi:uncharacterized protein involved in exopolysaccharide biosynthesis